MTQELRVFMAWRDMYGQAIGGRGRSASMAASHEQGGETLSRESIGVLPADSTFPADNTASRLLAKALSLPAPG